ncbi:TetR/AcrR family transcriptional regulator [Arthrobacter sp. NPDC057013]|uniref:TetR/AcrR family transcriptional regulator n=1 Tax=Arthrobacter sp. NPDC057013 TaxID=3345999 RepID=UPI00363D6F9D
MSLDSQRLPYGDGRDALLAAVIDVVAEKGLRGVTYRSVAARAGVNHTLITHHFGSIEGLLAATLEWAVQRSIDETGLARVADFDEQFADALLASVSAEPELQLFQFEMLLEARRKPELKALLDRLYGNYISTVETALRERSFDTDEELSRAVFAALDGLMLQFLTFGNPAKIRSAVIQVGRLLERSAAAGDASAAGLSPAR